MFSVTSANVGEIDDARINIVRAIYVFQRAIIFKIFFNISLLRCCTISYVIQVYWKREKNKIYTCKQFTRKNYDVILHYIRSSRYFRVHGCVKVFRHIAFHGKISRRAPNIPRGIVRHNTIISSFGKAINISSVSVADRATLALNCPLSYFITSNVVTCINGVHFKLSSANIVYLRVYVCDVLVLTVWKIKMNRTRKTPRWDIILDVWRDLMA